MYRQKVQAFKMTEKFSVAMSVYKNDKPEWFELSLLSIINQTIRPTEIVLIVDGPIPIELHNVIDNYKANNPGLFNVIEFSENKGLGVALKTAVENCRYELIARMDSDDIAVSNRFEKQLAYFSEHSNVDIVGGNIAEFIDDVKNVIGKRVVPSADSDIREYIKQRCPFNHMTVMFKKSAVLKSGNYKHWFWNEDYYLWIRMLLADCSFGNLEEILVNVRVGKDMYARRGGLKYYRSEAKLQRFMYQKGIITFPRAFLNIAQRFILQVLMPNFLRAIIFKTLARSK